MKKTLALIGLSAILLSGCSAPKTDKETLPTSTRSVGASVPKPTAPVKPTIEAVKPTTPVKAPSVQAPFKNCTEVRAAGKAPIKVGDPGWNSKLDRDKDGVGCDK